MREQPSACCTSATPTQTVSGRTRAVTAEPSGDDAAAGRQRADADGWRGTYGTSANGGRSPSGLGNRRTAIDGDRIAPGASRDTRRARARRAAAASRNSAVTDRRPASRRSRRGAGAWSRSSGTPGADAQRGRPCGAAAGLRRHPGAWRPAGRARSPRRLSGEPRSCQRPPRGGRRGQRSSQLSLEPSAPANGRAHSGLRIRFGIVAGSRRGSGRRFAAQRGQRSRPRPTWSA